MSVHGSKLVAQDSLILPVVWERIEYFEAIRRAVLFLEKHLAERISEQEVASVACLEQTAFSKVFRRRTGVTFREFVESLRLSRAIEGMLHSDQSLTEIALAVGFVSLTNFGRAFRRRLGVAPSTYRKILLKHNGLLPRDVASEVPSTV